MESVFTTEELNLLALPFWGEDEKARAERHDREQSLFYDVLDGISTDTAIEDIRIGVLANVALIEAFRHDEPNDIITKLEGRGNNRSVYKALMSRYVMEGFTYAKIFSWTFYAANDILDHWLFASYDKMFEAWRLRVPTLAAEVTKLWYNTDRYIDDECYHNNLAHLNSDDRMNALCKTYHHWEDLNNQFMELVAKSIGCLMGENKPLKNMREVYKDDLMRQLLKEVEIAKKAKGSAKGNGLNQILREAIQKAEVSKLLRGVFSFDGLVKEDSETAKRTNKTNIETCKKAFLRWLKEHPQEKKRYDEAMKKTPQNQRQ